jgi:hypothetical protein
MLAELDRMDPKGVAKLEVAYRKKKTVWFPTAGPQSEAYYSRADVLLYGGAAAAGKSDLGLGLAFTAHQRSLILRRSYSNLSGLTDRAIQINGSRNGFNGSPPPRLTTADGRVIQFMGCQHLGDEQSAQGIPFDFKCFDESVAFLEQMVRFHLGWVRSADMKQRCRALLATNPPVTADGDWIIGMFRPWLDLTHPNPAAHGELRYYVTAPDGSDLEVADGTPIEMDGRKLVPQSRSFIPGKLGDNPFLVRTNYQATLDALPEPLRTAVRDGNFMVGRNDARGQVIPTAWIMEAQNRWKPDGYGDKAMTAMAVDPAGGGKDAQEVCWRHGGWFAEIVSETGEHTAKPGSATATIFMNRRDGAPIVVDVGGGYASGLLTRLDDNHVEYMKFNGAAATGAKSKEANLPFYNERAKMIWRLREELDPAQFGGSAIALPPDPEIRADLASWCMDLRHLEIHGEIKIESKEEIRKRLGRSTGKGDVIAMSLTAGAVAVRRAASKQKMHTLPTHAKMRAGPLGRRRTPSETNGYRP